jgi:hypothetical protein
MRFALMSLSLLNIILLFGCSSQAVNYSTGIMVNRELASRLNFYGGLNQISKSEMNSLHVLLKSPNCNADCEIDPGCLSHE